MVETQDLRFGTNSSLTVLLDSTEVVNDEKDSLRLALHVPMWILAAFVNSWAMAEVWKKDSNGLNNVILSNCLANILYCSLVLVKSCKIIIKLVINNTVYILFYLKFCLYYKGLFCRFFWL